MNLAIHGRSTLVHIDTASFTHMISIGDVGCNLAELRPASLDQSTQLCMNFRDRKTPERRDAPTEQDILPLFEWLDLNAPIERLLVHCGAGMSRSPAIALLALCHLSPDSDVFENMTAVASSSAVGYIWPNPLVVQLGDAIMNQNGRIVSGVDEWRRIVDPEIAG